jgi:hypothetical protein
MTRKKTLLAAPRPMLLGRLRSWFNSRPGKLAMLRLFSSNNNANGRWGLHIQGHLRRRGDRSAFAVLRPRQTQTKRMQTNFLPPKSDRIRSRNRDHPRPDSSLDPWRDHRSGGPLLRRTGATGPLRSSHVRLLSVGVHTVLWSW